MTKKALFVLLLAGGLLADGPVEYRKVGRPGTDVHYRIIGAGAPLLILGGGPGDNADRYLGLCELLSGSCRCILVDQRGTGKSLPAVLNAGTVSVDLTLDDFEAIRRELGIETWPVLGFSYGGYLASLYAQQHPASISRLLLLDSMGLNTDAFAYFVDNITSRLSPADLGLFAYWSDPARDARDPHHALVERIRARMPGYFFDRKKSLIVSQAMRDSDFNFDMGRWIWEDVEKKGLDLAKMESRFDKPVLVLHGRQDPLGESVPLAVSRYYKNSRLVFIEKCGHYSWIEQPEKVLASIREFLAPIPAKNRPGDD